MRLRGPRSADGFPVDQLVDVDGALHGLTLPSVDFQEFLIVVGCGCERRGER